ncbi:hypothetical protein DRN46_04565 [Thermococci archaeon]|nr:MAG: hypothetical protein DRN46_04565 [Thermococci archaeon]RLF97098.1 MAG: hypothetical protein DRN52_01150 [Thermococci archaeon]
MIITTSRRPTRRVRTFGRDLERNIPGSTYITRGKKGIRDLADLALSHGVNKVLVVGVTKGNPGKLLFLEVNYEWRWVAFLSINNVKLQREHLPVRFKKARGRFGVLNEAGEIGEIVSEFLGGEQTNELNLREFESIMRIWTEEDVVRCTFYRREVPRERVGPSFSITGWKIVAKERLH